MAFYFYNGWGGAGRGKAERSKLHRSSNTLVMLWVLVSHRPRFESPLHCDSACSLNCKMETTDLFVCIELNAVSGIH